MSILGSIQHSAARRAERDRTLAVVGRELRQRGLALYDLWDGNVVIQTDAGHPVRSMTYKELDRLADELGVLRQPA